MELYDYDRETVEDYMKTGPRQPLKAYLGYS